MPVLWQARSFLTWRLEPIQRYVFTVRCPVVLGGSLRRLQQRRKLISVLHRPIWKGFFLLLQRIWRQWFRLNELWNILQHPPTSSLTQKWPRASWIWNHYQPESLHDHSPLPESNRGAKNYVPHQTSISEHRQCFGNHLCQRCSSCCWTVNSRKQKNLQFFCFPLFPLPSFGCAFAHLMRIS